MKKTVATALVLDLLAACSRGEDAESADDYAKRVGFDENAGVPSQASDVQTTAAAEPLDLEKLGDISRVDLGPRDGGRTFSQQGTELLLSGARKDPSAAGKAVVRVASENGMGVSRRANLVVTDARGEQRSFDRGDWVCSG